MITNRHSWARLSALAATGLLIVASSLAFAAPASAHARLTSSTPGADELVATGPSEVVLRFDEAVSVGLGGIQVIAPDGVRVEGPSELRADDFEVAVPIAGDQRGTYTVAWRVTSADSHTIEGSFVFHVGEETGAAATATTAGGWATALGLVGRWLALGGSLVALGLVGWWAISGRGADARLSALGATAAGSVALGAFIVLVARTGQASGEQFIGAIGAIPEAISEVRFAQLLAIQIALAAVMTASWLVRSRPALWATVLATSTIGVMVLSTLGGHAWTSSLRSVSVVGDLAHQISGGWWLGGLAALLATAATDQWDDSVRRFSRGSALALLALGLSGVASATSQLIDVEDLWTTNYGRLVLGKIVLFVVIVVLGLINRRAYLPVLETAATKLRRVVRVEVVVGLAAVALAAGLVDAVPPNTPLVEPYNETIIVDDTLVNLWMSPSAPGPNVIHLTTEPVSRSLSERGTDAVELFISTNEIPARKINMQPIGVDHFVAEDVTLTEGVWRMDVTIVRQGVVNDVVFDVPIT